MEAPRGLSSATLSTQSASLTCRICQDGNSLEPLLNACDCSGSIGLVHAICLEKWLSQSSRESCELCQYEFKTVKKVKNFQQVRFLKLFDYRIRRTIKLLNVFICYEMIDNYHPCAYYHISNIQIEVYDLYEIALDYENYNLEFHCSPRHFIRRATGVATVMKIYFIFTFSSYVGTTSPSSKNTTSSQTQHVSSSSHP